MVSLNFNAEQVEPSSGNFEPVPAGWYPVMITESEIKQNSKQNGHYLEMIAKILDGADYAGRQFFIRLNIDNPNETAVRIAQEQLSAICHAVGVLQVQDSQQLHGLPFELKVKVKPADDQYEASNEVKGFRALEGTTANSAAPSSGEPAWVNKDKPAAEKKPAPAQKAAPAKKAEKKLEMIDTEYTYEEWKETGRSDQEMVDEGIAKWVEVKAPPAKKSPPAKATPAKKDQANASAAVTGSESSENANDADLPPWMQKQQ